MVMESKMVMESGGVREREREREIMGNEEKRGDVVVRRDISL